MAQLSQLSLSTMSTYSCQEQISQKGLPLASLVHFLGAGPNRSPQQSQHAFKQERSPTPSPLGSGPVQGVAHEDGGLDVRDQGSARVHGTPADPEAVRESIRVHGARHVDHLARDRRSSAAKTRGDRDRARQRREETERQEGRLNSLSGGAGQICCDPGTKEAGTERT